MDTEKPTPTFGHDDAGKVGQSVELTDLRSKPCKQALALWNELRGERKFPSREVMTARRMAPFLSNLTLVDIMDGGEDFIGRVTGEAVVQLYGPAVIKNNRDGLNAVHPGMGDVSARLYKSVFRRQAPLALRGWLELAKHDLVFHETLVLPLGPDDQTVETAVNVAAYARSYSQSQEPEF